MPVPGKTTTPMGSTSRIWSLRLKGAACLWRVKSGLKAICATPRFSAQGYAGLQDRVDNHWGALQRGALVSTLLSVGANAGATGQNGDLAIALRRGTSDAINQVGNQVVGRQLDIQPTLTIRPGFPARVLVTRDLILAPYEG